jgi:RNA polymerase sigma factor (sigma-70 family)
MPTGRLNHVLDRLCRESPDRTDADLLEDYVTRLDEAAFEALVRRHGAMVLGVCRRLLGELHDAEDVFQATFLVLVRKAESVRPRENLASWLYGVAYHAAQKARALATRRRAREKHMPPPEPETVAQGLWDDLLPLLDRELSCLPPNYRLPLVLHHLESRSRSEVARQLGLPDGTVASRLARGRALLAKRLRKHGIPISAGVVAAVLAQNAVGGAVPLVLLHSTIRMADQAVVGELVTPVVQTIAQEVLKAMMRTRLAIPTAVLVMLGVMTAGATLALYRPTPAEPVAAGPPADLVAPVARVPDAAPKAVEARTPVRAEETAWGEVVDGLQVRIAYPPGPRRAYQVGDAVTFVVKVRNVGQASIPFYYYAGFPADTNPAVEDPRGRPASLALPPRAFYMPTVKHRTLAAGEEMEIGRPGLATAAAQPTRPPDKPTLVDGPGAYRVRYAGVAWRYDSADHPGRVSTGKLELALGAAGEAKSAPGPVDKAAWGKAVRGLQAGIEYLPGKKRAYRLGEAVPLRILLHNVGGKPLTLKYDDGFFVRHLPTVSDDRGRPVRLSPPVFLDGLWRHHERTLAPDEVFVLASVSLHLEPADGKATGHATLFAAPGRYHLHYTGLPPFEHADRANQLSTGKLELEVQAASEPAKAPAGDLEGTWQAVSFEQDARVWPADKVRDIRAGFTGGRYQLTTGLRVQGAGDGSLSVHPETSPKSFELTPRAGPYQGKAFPGIFSVEGDMLTLCFAWPLIERPTEFHSPPDSTVVLAVLRRVRP